MIMDKGAGKLIEAFNFCWATARIDQNNCQVFEYRVCDKICENKIEDAPLFDIHAILLPC